MRAVEDQVDRAHHHARSAEAALQAVTRPEGRLHGVQRAIGWRDALDRRDVLALHLGDEHIATLDGTTLQVDRAGAAACGVASHMRARQPQMLAQEGGQQGVGIDLGRYLGPVDVQLNRHAHDATP